MRTLLYASCVLALAGGVARASNTYPACSATTFDVLAAGSGCEQGDKIFSQFSYDLNNGTSAPAESAINVGFSGTDPAGPITSTYSSSAWSDVSSSNSVFLYNYTQVDQTLDPGYVITGFDLNPGTVSFTGTPAPGDGVQIIVDICTNLDTNSCGLYASNSGELDYTYDSTGSTTMQYCYATCIDGANTGSLSLSFDPSLGITSIFVTDWVIIDQASADVTLSGLSNDYFEGPDTATPEPGGLLLLGSGLAGIALLRRKSRKARG